MRRLRLTVALALLLGCESVTDPDGSWMGSMQIGDTVWALRLTLIQNGDSLTGSAEITSSESNWQYFVNGNYRGDSVTVRLRPVEDPDINIAGTIDGTRIVAEWWFNDNTASKGHVVLGKQ
jgi:hypothetical protein